MYKSSPIPLPSARDSAGQLLTPAEFARASGASLSTVWRRLRANQLPSIKRKGRRFIPISALQREVEAKSPVTADHPIWKLVGAGKSGGQGPGSSDKYRVLADERLRRAR